MQKIDKLFLDSDAQAEPIKGFLEERLRLLDERTRSPGWSMPRLSGEGRLFIHVVPLDTFGRQSVIPLNKLRQDYSKWLSGPVNLDHESAKPNPEGLLVMRSLEDSPSETGEVLCLETAQVFHNGVVEVANGDWKNGEDGSVDLPELSKFIQGEISAIIKILNKIGIELEEPGLQGKFAVFISLYDLEGGLSIGGKGRANSVDRRELRLPGRLSKQWGFLTMHWTNY